MEAAAAGRSVCRKPVGVIYLILCGCVLFERYSRLSKGLAPSQIIGSLVECASVYFTLVATESSWNRAGLFLDSDWPVPFAEGVCVSKATGCFPRPSAPPPPQGHWSFASIWAQTQPGPCSAPIRQNFPQLTQRTRWLVPALLLSEPQHGVKCSRGLSPAACESAGVIGTSPPCTGHSLLMALLSPSWSGRVTLRSVPGLQ